jgi:hypothetical protein
MPRHTRRLQKQAASLFMLAEDAFGRGKTQLGEELTALALRYLDELHALETAPSSPRAAEPEHPGQKTDCRATNPQSLHGHLPGRKKRDICVLPRTPRSDDWSEAGTNDYRSRWSATVDAVARLYSKSIHWFSGVGCE